MIDEVRRTRVNALFGKNILGSGKLLFLCWLLCILFVPLTQSKAFVNKSRKLKNSVFKELFWETIIQDIQSLTSKLAARSEGNALGMQFHASKREDGLKYEFPHKNKDVPELTLLRNSFFKRRKKRELEKQGEMSAAVMSIRMPSYYPFIMAEMIPGSVETRHPSIIAVKGCPAYYIADHKGRCKQVFQYTVNFQQRPAETQVPKRFNFPHPQVQQNNQFFNTPTFNIPMIRPRQISTAARNDRIRNNPRLLSLLRLAAKKFDAALQKAESSSAESKDEYKSRTFAENFLKISRITEKSDFGVDLTNPLDSRNGDNFNTKANESDSDD